MSGQRRLFLDRAPGEARGVVLLDGAPERLLIEREPPGADAVGAAGVARVRRIERAMAAAFLELSEGAQALLPLTGEAARLSEGAAVEVEIVAPARRNKAAVARLIGFSEGAPRALRPPPSLIERLAGFAPGIAIVEGEAAREAADIAEDAAIAIEHPLPGGGSLAIEATRALVAVDVDAGSLRPAQANREAITLAARLLRLKGLAGLIAIDLAGGGQDGAALAEVAKAAFAPDQPGVALGPVSRFGLMQLVLPWRTRPLADVLLDEDGRPSAQTLARRLARAIEAEARGATRVIARCSPAVAVAAETLRPALVERLGPRFDIQAEPAFAHDAMETRPA